MSHGRWLIHLNRNPRQLAAWLIEDADTHVIRPVLGVQIQAPAKTNHDEMRGLYSIEVEGYLTIRAGIAIISRYAD